MKICASCAEENPDRARFCINCGTELRAEQDERFRKVITLLFCDVADSAELSARLAPDALSQVLTAYFDEMRPIVERHGGTVAKFIGDAIMSVFGIPVLHEDDALRACRAALEMQERLADLNVGLEERWSVTLGMRMGLNTGEVSGVGVARAQNFVAGDAANTAARFQQGAQTGQILLGDSTYRLVRDGVQVDEVEPLTMKGKEGPVRAYNLRGVSADAEALKRRHQAPLVGREEELVLLEGAFRTAVEDRACVLATLLADAGSGKSRLVEELARRVDDVALVLRGRCLSYGEGITFWPLLEIVRQLGNLDESDPRDVACRKLVAVAGHGSEDEVERVASAVGLSDAEFPLTEIYWGTRKLFERIAENVPLVVVFDDVHWAEPAMLDLIEHLLETVADTSVLLVCPARPEFVEQRPAWQSKPGVTQLRLRPLSEAEVNRVISNMLGDVDIADDARARVVAAAEGNPLFVEQMLSMMLDEGLLRRTNGRYEAASDLSRVSVPPSINALLAARVDGLPPGERAVLEPASVFGLVFPQAAIEELTDEPVQPAVPAHLSALIEKQLVRGSGVAVETEEFRFGHLLIRDATYDGLLKEARAKLHERVALWSERVNRERGREAEFAEVLGYHLEQAHRYLAELGTLDEHGRELGIRAALRLASAGHRAFQRGDMQAAANLLARAAALRSASDPRRLELLPDLAEALTAIGEFTRAIEFLDDAVAQAQQLGDRTLLAEATLVRLFVQAFATDAGWGEEIVPEAERAMAVLEEAGEHAGLAKGWRLMAQIHGTACQYGDAANAVQQAIGQARLAGDRRQELRNTSAYAQALLAGPTPVAEAIEECNQILDRAGSDRGTRAFVLAVLAPLLAMRGELAEARTSYVSSRALYEDLGNTVLAAWVSLHSGPAELLAGDLRAAERELQRSYDALDRIGEKYFLSTVAGLLGQARYARGRYDDALAYAETARTLSTDDDVESQALWRSVRAKVLARQDEASEAVALAGEAVALARHTDSPVVQADALVDLAEVWRLTGLEWRAALDEAIVLYEQKGNVVGAMTAGGLLLEPAEEPRS